MPSDNDNKETNIKDSKEKGKLGRKRKMVQSNETVKKVKLNSGQGVMKRSVKEPKMSKPRKKLPKPKMYVAQKIVGRQRNRLEPLTGKRMVEYLVRWKGYGPEYDTWEDCKSDVLRSEGGREMIKDFLNTLRQNSSDAMAMKNTPVVLNFGDGMPKINHKNVHYVRVNNTSKRDGERNDGNDVQLPAVCDEVAAKWAQIGQDRAANKARKVASKLQSSKAKALKTLQRKQNAAKRKNSAKTVNKKKNELTKVKRKYTRKDASKTKKSSQVIKRVSVSLKAIGAVSSSSSESDVLYSLADEDAAGDGAMHPSRKRLFLEVSAEHRASESSTGTPDTDPEISFKKSPRKRMLLKDSIRPKTEPSCLELVTPATPASHPSPYRTPPSSPGGAGPSIQTPPLANRASTGMAEVIPSSPAAATYMKNITATLQQKTKKKQGSDSGSSSIERRVSVRQSEGVFKYKEIVVKKCSGYTQIMLYSQTQAKNALNPAVFAELQQVLHSAKFDDTRVVLLSGSGNTFCSGVDLHYLIEGDPRQRAQQMADALKEFVITLIHFPKPIVVAVNGPAVGLGVTLLPLCDIVYASDKATFYCPYSRLGQTPEGTASYTFPSGLGVAMANDLLLAGRRLTATQAMQAGLVSQVFWPTTFMDDIVARVVKISEQAVTTPAAKAMELSKMLIRGPVKAKLLMSNESETAVLGERWSAADCQRLIRTYVDEEQHLFL